MSAEDHPAMELTRDPITQTWGFVCREHGILRTGLTEPHARNVEAKHLREDHADALVMELDLKAAAEALKMEEGVPRFDGAMTLWMALTGMERRDAAVYALQVLTTEGPVTAAVAPF